MGGFVFLQSSEKKETVVIGHIADESISVI